MQWAEPESQSVPAARSAHSACAYGSKLYILGGWDGDGELADLQVLNVDEWSWEQMNPTGQLPAARHFHTAAMVDHLQFVFGGYDGRSWLNDLWCLNVETMMWKQPTVAGEPPPSR